MDSNSDKARVLVPLQDTHHRRTTPAIKRFLERRLTPHHFPGKIIPTKRMVKPLFETNTIFLNRHRQHDPKN